MGYVEEKSCRLVVVGIEGEPCDRVPALPKFVRPGERERCLAEARSRLDHYKLLLLQLSGHAEQPGAIDQPRRTAWRHDFGGEELRLCAGDHVLLCLPVSGYLPEQGQDLASPKIPSFQLLHYPKRSSRIPLLGDAVIGA